VERKERETGRNGDGGKQGEERSGEIDKRKARGTRQEEANRARLKKLPSEICSFLNLCFAPVKYYLNLTG
jgi:hypothetical protein